ncbi:hypothetical protein [Tenacibaculum jejuense]|uniref:Uncharacterized protein n=1 Tax=Tenacibaculum jejuense TaxID=584609 RepID=A0A238UD76_9FLAO|nr:hypothetical protein [Tenacibaculum jejuense]SNR17022.1 exported protein of unknown function [Tenacibaculum jejuense]
MRRRTSLQVVILLILSVTLVNAQKVVEENGLQYLKNQKAENLNTIDRPSFMMNVKVQKKKGEKAIVSTKIISTHKTKLDTKVLRFRKKRICKSK